MLKNFRFILILVILLNLNSCCFSFFGKGESLNLSYTSNNFKKDNDGTIVFGYNPHEKIVFKSKNGNFNLTILINQTSGEKFYSMIVFPIPFLPIIPIFDNFKNFNSSECLTKNIKFSICLENNTNNFDVDTNKIYLLQENSKRIYSINGKNINFIKNKGCFEIEFPSNCDEKLYNSELVLDGIYSDKERIVFDNIKILKRKGYFIIFGYLQ